MNKNNVCVGVSAGAGAGARAWISNIINIRYLQMLNECLIDMRDNSIGNPSDVTKHMDSEFKQNLY
jgi:hypothetical protein